MRFSKFRSASLVAALLLSQGLSHAASLSFSSATATFEQNFFSQWTAAQSIDGLIPAPGTWASGWAIYDQSQPVTQVTGSQTALFTLATPLAAGTYTLTYTLTQNYGQNHTLDTFSLGFTTAAAPVLSSAQTQVAVTAASATGGASLSFAGGALDAAGLDPATSVYSITATVNSAAPITALYLNALDNGGAGPGRQGNGNFVLTEFAVSAAPVPEPSQWALMLSGLAVVGQLARRRLR